MSKGIVNRRDKFLWDNSAKPSITDVEGSGGGGTQLKSETTPVIPYAEIYDDNGTWKAKDFYRSDFTGNYYQFENTGETPFPQAIITVQMYDMGDPMGSFTLDLREMSSDTWSLYAFGTGTATAEYYGTEQPVVTTEYEELTLGSDLSVVNGTLHGPNLSSYGKTLNVDGRYLSLYNGNNILSRVTLPIPESGLGVTTFYATDSGSNRYTLPGSAVATEIYNKLSNDEDVQIVLAKTDGSKIICRCFGFRPENEGVADAAYLFAGVLFDLAGDGVRIYTFDLMSGNSTLAIATLEVS